MQTFFEYMMKTTAAYAVVYLFYRFVLSKLTSYKSNRYYLLMAGVFAFIVPLLQPAYFLTPQILNTSGLIKSIPNVSTLTNMYVPAESNNNIPVVMMTLYLSGIVVCLAYFIMQLLSFKRITSGARLLQTDNGIKLFQLDNDIMPFSFGRNIYVNQNRHSQTELNDILQHEAVHVQQHHTIDVMIAEFICMLNWFNPFAWLIKSAIKQNLEFLADDTVLKSGADRKSYQYLLLKVTGYSPLTIASSFKLSSLKQRIYMMNKTRTSQRHLLKLLFVLPVIAFMMLAFRNDGKVHVANTTNSNATETFMLTTLTYNIQDASINTLVNNAQKQSLLKTGKSFSLTTIMQERDRLKLLLEKNGYNNINSHAITFMLDSTFENHQCAIEVNIDLKRKEISSNKTGKTVNPIAAGKTEDDHTNIVSTEQKHKPVS